jgi:hypothetical protein
MSIRHVQPFLAPTQDRGVLEPALVVMEPTSKQDQNAFVFDALSVYVVVGSAIIRKSQDAKDNNLDNFFVLNDFDIALSTLILSTKQ